MISDKISTITYENLQTEAIEIATITASTPAVIDNLAGQGDPQDLQRFANRISAISGVRFVVVMDMNRKRMSHPDASKIGTYYENNDANEAFLGNPQTSIDSGSLGESLRAFAPVYTAQGKQVGVVLVGIMLDEVTSAVTQSRGSVVFGSICGLVIGILGAVFLARQIKKYTFGMEPFAIAKMLEERNAILESIREGAFAIDQEEKITMINKAAMRVLNNAELKGDLIGKNVEDFIPNTRMQNVLKTGKAELDQEQNLNGLTILTSRIPVYVNNEIVGVVATFRDKSEMQKLAEKLMDVKIYAEELRSQTHEFMNKLHVVVGMIHLGNYDQVKDYIAQIAHTYQVEVGAVVRAIKDPVLAGFLLGKLSLAREVGVKMKLTEDSFVPDLFEADIVHDLITIIGNLVTNALESLEKTDVKELFVKILHEDDRLFIEVRDTGRGMEQKQIKFIYENGYSTKGENRGIGLYITKRSLAHLQGTIYVLSELGQGTTFYVSLPYRSKERFFD